MGRVFYADLWGLREEKYRSLFESEVESTTWQELEPAATPNFFFVPKELDLMAEYQRGWSVADMFPLTSTGIKTHRDHFVIDFDEALLHARIATFRDQKLSDEEVRSRFNLSDTRDWKLPEARARLQTKEDWEEGFSRCLYRPFDIRPIYYSGDVVELPRPEVMRHMLAGENLALMVGRSSAVIGDKEWNIVGVSSSIVDVNFYRRGGQQFHPLYLYPATKADSEKNLLETPPWPIGRGGRVPNLNPEFVKEVEGRLGLEFISEGRGDLDENFGPEDIFDYIYAIFHSPAYRARYAEFLKIDFPRVPLTSQRELFQKLCGLGGELVALHLLEAPRLSQPITRYPLPGDNRVEKGYPRYLAEGEPEPGTGRPLAAGRVYINKEQYFEGVPKEVWEFQVGGYQVCEKWLKDRRGRKLTYDELSQYQKVVVALWETLRLMEEVDRVIGGHGGWPIGERGT